MIKERKIIIISWFFVVLIFLMTDPATAQDKNFENKYGMKFILIPSGTYTMGSPENEPGRTADENRHQITISKSFYMQTTEMTQAQWKKVMGSNPSGFNRCGDNCPVEQVSWNDVQEFIRKLNQMDKGNLYRLPTESEWEYAARAGTTTPFHTGNCLLTSQANVSGTIPYPNCSKGKYRGKTMPVASFTPNAWGLYDMHGNVWEWCREWKWQYPLKHVIDPPGSSVGRARVIRGGDWGLNAKDCRSAVRGGAPANYRSKLVGFRLVKAP